jgi:hypothetical protein
MYSPFSPLSRKPFDWMQREGVALSDPGSADGSVVEGLSISATAPCLPVHENAPAEESFLTPVRQQQEQEAVAHSECTNHNERAVDSGSVNQTNQMQSVPSLGDCKGWCVIQFISAVDLTSADSKLANSTEQYVRAHIAFPVYGPSAASTPIGTPSQSPMMTDHCGKATRETNLVRISEYVGTPRRDSRSTVVWNTFRNFKFLPPPKSVLVLELFETSPHSGASKSGYRLIGHQHIPIDDCLMDEEVKMFHFDSAKVNSLTSSKVYCYYFINFGLC